MGNEPVDRPPKAAPTESVVGSKNASDSETGERKWLMQEAWTTRAEGVRGLHTSRLWYPDTGVHLATTIQVGLVKFQPESKDEVIARQSLDQDLEASRI